MRFTIHREDAEVDGGLTVTHLGAIDPTVLYIDDEQSQITFDTTSRTSTVATAYAVEIFLYYEFVDGVFENAEDEGLYVAGASGGIEVALEENGEDWY